MIPESSSIEIWLLTYIQILQIEAKYCYQANSVASSASVSPDPLPILFHPALCSSRLPSVGHVSLAPGALSSSCIQAKEVLAGDWKGAEGGLGTYYQDSLQAGPQLGSGWAPLPRSQLSSDSPFLPFRFLLASSISFFPVSPQPPGHNDLLLLLVPLCFTISCWSSSVLPSPLLIGYLLHYFYSPLLSMPSVSHLTSTAMICKHKIL